MKKVNIKSQAGFSLIELMVVVGIIGILAAIAVPQFSKFQARARQSEVKSNLAALFSAEKAFFSEWNHYTVDVANAGFGAKPSPREANPSPRGAKESPRGANERSWRGAKLRSSRGAKLRCSCGAKLPPLSSRRGPRSLKPLRSA